MWCQRSEIQGGTAKTLVSQEVRILHLQLQQRVLRRHRQGELVVRIPDGIQVVVDHWCQEFLVAQAHHHIGIRNVAKQTRVFVGQVISSLHRQEERPRPLHSVATAVNRGSGRRWWLRQGWSHLLEVGLSHLCIEVFPVQLVVQHLEFLLCLSGLVLEGELASFFGDVELASHGRLLQSEQLLVVAAIHFHLLLHQLLVNGGMGLPLALIVLGA
mmetsp:Transcript_60345/g.132163  ORF Transcript_60345/g.132163 Transcript_60345/m.132163 type:complete len:214 (+) Transcript_60345:123-764(+)